MSGWLLVPVGTAALIVLWYRLQVRRRNREPVTGLRPDPAGWGWITDEEKRRFEEIVAADAAAAKEPKP
jgi:hypothetical protein